MFLWIIEGLTDFEEISLYNFNVILSAEPEFIFGINHIQPRVKPYRKTSVHADGNIPDPTMSTLQILAYTCCNQKRIKVFF